MSQSGSDGTGVDGKLGNARTPAAAPAVTPVGIVLAVAVIALGFVGIEEALTHIGVVGKPSWLEHAVAVVNGTGPQFWMVPVGILVALLGLWLILLGLKPRRRTGVALGSDASIWLRPTDVARIAGDTARHTPGVISASASATRREVRVKVSSTARGADGIREEVAAAVTDRLAALPSRPRVSVQAHIEGDSS